MYGEAGNHHKALEYREKALKSLLQLFGDNHHHTAIAYSNVGYAYGALGSYPKALEYHERAVYINQESAHHISENQLQTLFEGSSKAFSTFPEPSDGANTILFTVPTHRMSNSQAPFM